MASAASSTGVSSDHRAVRDDGVGRATSTCTPRARALTSASGESAAPTVSSEAPRRAASAARASGTDRAAGLRDGDDEVERAHPAGQRRARAGWSRGPASRARRGGRGRRRPARNRRAPRRAPTAGARRRRPARCPASCADTSERRTCAPAEASERSESRVSRTRSASGSSRRLSSTHGIRVASSCAPAQAGRRASSTRSTGTPSSIR